MYVTFGGKKKVVDRVCQHLLGKILESLNQNLRDVGSIQILLFHLIDMETQFGRV